MSHSRGTDESDGRLLRRVCRGDVAAFEALCLVLERPLFSYLLRLVGSRAEAEDLAQETLFRLYRTAREGRLRTRTGAPRALAFTIAHNLAVDYRRRARNVVPLTGGERAPSQGNPAWAAEQALLREQIDRALAELPENHRSALMLREFGELTYAEIAGALDVKEGLVKAWIYRARRRLSELLDRDGQYVGEGSDGV